MAGTDPAVRSHWQVLHQFRAHATYAAWEHVLHTNIYAASQHVLHIYATCTRCLDWPVRSHWPTHPLQEVWLTGEQIRSRLSTSPNLTPTTLSARVKAARKQQQQKKNSFSSSSSSSSIINPMFLPPPTEQTQLTLLSVLAMTSTEFLTTRKVQHRLVIVEFWHHELGQSFQ